MLIPPHILNLLIKKFDCIEKEIDELISKYEKTAVKGGTYAQRFTSSGSQRPSK